MIQILSEVVFAVQIENLLTYLFDVNMQCSTAAVLQNVVVWLFYGQTLNEQRSFVKPMIDCRTK